MSTRNFALGAIGIVLLLLIVPAVIRGGKTEDVAALKLELERANKELEQKKAEAERISRLEAETRLKLSAQEDAMRERMRDILAGINDQNQKAEAQRKLEQQKRDAEKLLADMKAQADASKAALDAAQQRQQTIIHSAPPVYYYPPYHYRYYWPWW